MYFSSNTTQVHKGVKGQVVDDATSEGIKGAVIMVSGINHNITSVNNGDYWRLLVPDTYDITVLADG